MSFYADPGDGVQMPTAAPVNQRARVLVAVGVALAVGVLGLGVGLLWRVVAPHVRVIKAEQGFLYAEAQPEQAVAADGWFAFLGLAMGVLVAITAWIVARHHRGMWVLVGLVVGSLAGAWAGWRLGVYLEIRQFEAIVNASPIGAYIDAPLSLRITDLDRTQFWPPRATGVVAAQALAAAATYTTLAGFAADPHLRANPPEVEEGQTIEDWAMWPVPVRSQLPTPQPPTVSPPATLSQASTAPQPPQLADPGPPEPAWPPRPEPGPSSGPAAPSGPPGWPAQP